MNRVKRSTTKEGFGCFKCGECGDGNTPLYCMNCADALLKIELASEKARADRAEAELGQAKKELADAAEGFEQLAFSFPQIQVDCDNPIAAAQLINREWEQAIKERDKARAACAEKHQALELARDIIIYAATVRLDRRKVVDDTVMCLQTEDWCNGLLERLAAIEPLQKAFALLDKEGAK